jgi:hypothetical protein
MDGARAVIRLGIVWVTSSMLESGRIDSSSSHRMSSLDERSNALPSRVLDPYEPSIQRVPFVQPSVLTKSGSVARRQSLL